jgi:hypothetical protein
MSSSHEATHHRFLHSMHSMNLVMRHDDRGGVWHVLCHLVAGSGHRLMSSISVHRSRLMHGGDWLCHRRSILHRRCCICQHRCTHEEGWLSGDWFRLWLLFWLWRRLQSTLGALLWLLLRTAPAHDIRKKPKECCQSCQAQQNWEQSVWWRLRGGRRGWDVLRVPVLDELTCNDAITLREVGVVADKRIRQTPSPSSCTLSLCVAAFVTCPVLAIHLPGRAPDITVANFLAASGDGVPV